MGLFEKVEGTITLGLLAIAGYVFIKNYDTIKELWCKIPGVCGDVSPSCDIVAERAKCDNQGLLFNLMSCSCGLPIPDPGSNIDNPILPCPGNKPMHYTVEEGLHCDESEPYIPVTPAELCNDFGMDYNGSICVPRASCGDENPPGSGCYPNSQGMNELGQNCNVNCNTRCSDSQGNYRPCDVACDGIWYRETCVDPMDMPCPEGQIRDPLGAHLCINDTAGCMINMQNGGWMTLETWRNSPNLWENNLFLGDNGWCSI